MVKRAATPAADDSGGDYEAVDSGGMDERDLGDLAALIHAEEGWRWQVHRLKSPDEQAKNPRGKPRVWVTTINGALDLQDFHARHGGGAYEFWGSFNGEFLKKLRIELDGPPRFHDPTPPPTVVTTTPPTPNLSNDPMMMRLGLLLEDVTRRLQTIESRAVAPVRSEGISEVIAGVKAINEMVAPRNGGSDHELLNGFLDMFRQGLAMGQERDPVPVSDQEPRGTDWGKVVEVFGSTIERLSAARRVPQRGAPPPAAPTPAAPSPTGSSAEVVEPPVMSAEAARWITALDRLETSLKAGVGPDDAAEELDVILTDADLEQVLPFPNAPVIAQIVQRVRSDSVLATPDGRAYLELVLDELRKPDTGD